MCLKRVVCLVSIRDVPHQGGRKVTCGPRQAAMSDERGVTMKIAFVQP